MQITIDTKRDSRDDIVKVIRFLKTVIGDTSTELFSNKPRNIFEDSSPLPSLPSSSQSSSQSSSGSMFNMFDNPQPSSSQPSSSALLSEEPEQKQEENPEKDAKIELVY